MFYCLSKIILEHISNNKKYYTKKRESGKEPGFFLFLQISDIIFMKLIEERRISLQENNN